MKARKKNGGSLLMIIAIVLVVGPAFYWFYFLFEPVQLGIVHEQALGLLHNGVSSPQQRPSVEKCIPFSTQQRTPLQNATVIINGEERFISDGMLVENITQFRTTEGTQRLVTFGDRSQLSITFSGPPRNDPSCE
jgi:hypothetical protein